jgi:hypothetical protein
LTSPATSVNWAAVADLLAVPGVVIVLIST